MFEQLFQKRKFAFIPYVCLGYPTLSESVELVRALEPFADGFELGIPFSDPVADGPVLQKAMQTALENGFRLEQAFDTIRQIRAFTPKPIGILTYVNPVLAFGAEAIAFEAARAGANALMVPDAPLEEIGFVQKACAGKLEVPLFVTPTTPESRAREIASAATGFVYGIAVKGVTGTTESASTDFRALVAKIPEKPVVVGFGISRPEHAQAVKQAGAAGFIVGSQIVRTLDAQGLQGVARLAESLSPK